MKYVTKQGDTFDIIAYEAYGNEEYMSQIIHANEKYAGTAVFDYGVELELPTIKELDSSLFLPPWRR